MMNGSEVVTWEMIEPHAREMFNHWLGDGELAFVREAWSHLEKSGHTSMADVVSTTKAQLILVSLAEAYQEFCCNAWDESPDFETIYFCSSLELSDLALGVLSERLCQPATEVYEFEEDMRRDILVSVVYALRKDVFACLSNAYGGPEGLYARLYRTRALDVEDEGDDDDGGAYDMTGNNMMAFTFVMQGFN